MTMSNDPKLLNISSTYATETCNFILFYLETGHV